MLVSPVRLENDDQMPDRLEKQREKPYSIPYHIEHGYVRLHPNVRTM